MCTMCQDEELQRADWVKALEDRGFADALQDKKRKKKEDARYEGDYEGRRRGETLHHRTTKH